MEKSSPHCKLSEVKRLVQIGQAKATATAFQGARDLGIFNLDGMCNVILNLSPRDFYKSMTTYADHRIWQDVYHAKTKSGDEIYVKLTVVDDVLIVSFKEL